MTDGPIVKSVSYTAQAAPEGIELVVEAEMLSFVREMIPDGQMAGMMGHREVPRTSTVSYALHVEEAKHLLEQLGHAITMWEMNWGRRG